MRISDWSSDVCSSDLVAPHLGLGGRVLDSATPQRVEHYASTVHITHDFDHIVVDQEKLTAVAAVPIVVRGRVQGVLYGAVRGDHPLGDQIMRLAEIVADQLAQDRKSTRLNSSH